MQSPSEVIQPTADNRPPSLAILVPTFNRAPYLRTLLDRLAEELADCEDDVIVIVSDNDSSDETPREIATAKDRMPALISFRQPTNLGADGNIVFLLREGERRTDYIWLIGDDDLPAPHSVRMLMRLLRREQPSTVYLSSQWIPAGVPLHVGESTARTLSYDVMTTARFATRVHVWTTFISAWVIRADSARDRDVPDYRGSHLSQLAWTWPAILNGEKHLYVRDPVIRATGGNSGGYSRLGVFGTNFALITRAETRAAGHPRRLANRILRRSAVSYLPNQMLDARRSDPEGRPDQAAMPSAHDLGGWWWWHVVLRPVATGPAPLARLLVTGTHRTQRLLARVDSLRCQRAGNHRMLASD